MMQNIRWGIIGLGWFGEVHAEVLSTTAGHRIGRALHAPPAASGRGGRPFPRRAPLHRLSRAAGRSRTSTWSASPRTLTTIATSPSTRLRSGKHVFLEKPMAPTPADCDQILAAAEAAPGYFMVGHICRFDPRVALAKQAIDEGRIGQIVSMHARRNLSVTIGRMVLDSISALMGDGIHDGDLMLWFSQARPVSIYAQEIHPGSNKYPDGGWAMARLDNGAIAVIESIWHLPESTPYQIDARMEVIGTEGALYINCGEAGLEIHDGAGNHLPDTLYWPQRLWPAVWHSPRRAAVLRRLRGGGPSPGPHHAAASRGTPWPCWPVPRSRRKSGQMFYF